ncbi:MAG: M20 family metallo-hydrolase [Deltaproteobacteria bacterium]|nr:M20 family metallo-hydrolase [Deltaproteobacteria bacterium]
MGFADVVKKIEDSKNDIIELERGLVAIPALSPTYDAPPEQTGEAPKTAFLKQYLEQHGFTDLVEINAPDDRVPGGVRPNLIARIKGKTSVGTTWVMAHTDVVPPGDMEKWTTEPFELKVDGDRIYGRGVEDNHQGIVAGVMAARALLETGTTPPRDLAILFVADEECGSDYGIRYVLDNENPFTENDIIIVPDGGAADGSEIEVAEKSIMWIKFHVAGEQCHASMPDKGVNAMRAGANLIVRLDELNTIFGKADPVFEPKTSTFEPTKKEANVPNVNTIPGEDVFCYDCRVLPDYPLADVEAKIDEICKSVAQEYGVEVKFEFIQKEEAAPATSKDAAVVGLVRDAVREVHGVEARVIGIGGGTVAAFLRRKGLPCVVWSTMEETMHGPDENALISNMIKDAKVIAHIALAE